jgi:hypothetical protein
MPLLTHGSPHKSFGLESLIATGAEKPLVSLLAALAIPFKQKAAETSAALASLPGLPPQPRVRSSLEAKTESNERPAVVVSAVRRIRIAIVAVERVAAARIVATIVGPIVAMMAAVVAKRIVTMTPLAPM